MRGGWRMGRERGGVWCGEGCGGGEHDADTPLPVVGGAAVSGCVVRGGVWGRGACMPTHPCPLLAVQQSAIEPGPPRKDSSFGKGSPVVSRRTKEIRRQQRSGRQRTQGHTVVMDVVDDGAIGHHVSAAAGVDCPDLIDRREALVRPHRPALRARPRPGQCVERNALRPVGKSHVAVDGEHLVVGEHRLDDGAQLGAPRRRLPAVLRRRRAVAQELVSACLSMFEVSVNHDVRHLSKLGTTTEVWIMACVSCHSRRS